MKENPIVFFDGVCNFCVYWVNFSIKRDRRKKLRFAPMQGETAKNLFPQYGLLVSAQESVVLIEGGKTYRDSSAALRIAKHLSGGWKLFYGLIIIPKFIRDAVYQWIGKNRYKWYGMKNECMVPTDDLRERFLS